MTRLFVHRSYCFTVLALCQGRGKVTSLSVTKLLAVLDKKILKSLL